MKTAKIKIGDKTIEVPVHDELIHAIKSCENGLYDMPYEFTNFIRSFLPKETVKSHIEFDGIRVPFTEKAYVMDSLEYSLNKETPSEYEVDAFNELVRKIIPSSMRPPTEKQLWYAKKIATSLNINLPDDAGKTVEQCSEFIDQFTGEYLEEQETDNSIKIMARKGARGYIALFLLLNKKGDVLDLMRVAKNETVEKYIKNFAMMLEEYLHFEANKQKLFLYVFNELFSYNYEFLNLQPIPLDDTESIGNKFKAMLDEFMSMKAEK